MPQSRGSREKYSFEFMITTGGITYTSMYMPTRTFMQVPASYHGYQLVPYDLNLADKLYPEILVSSFSICLLRQYLYSFGTSELGCGERGLRNKKISIPPPCNLKLPWLLCHIYLSTYIYRQSPKIKQTHSNTAAPRHPRVLVTCE